MKRLQRLLFLALAFGCLYSLPANAQVSFTSWVHPPYITLYAAATGAGVSTSTGITVDDQYSDTLSIGFNFTFYGNTYSKLLIGANGNITFNDSLASGYNPWPITSSLLGNYEVYNSICGPWCDMDVVYGGDITYFTTGTAPNRIFGANYCHNGMYSSASCPGQYATTQILLYESTNVVESHITHKTVCTAWNGGAAVVGVQNATGTAATAAPGRDYPATWSATDEAWRFTPDSVGASYAVDSIAFAPMSYYTVYWYDSATGAYLGSGDSIVLAPLAPTTYAAYAVGCVDSASTGFDTVATGYMTLMPLSVGAVPLTNQITLFPNPAHNELSIVSGLGINSVLVTNIVGETLFSGAFAAEKKVALNTVNYPAGIYFVKIDDAEVKRFVKD